MKRYLKNLDSAKYDGVRPEDITVGVAATREEDAFVPIECAAITGGKSFAVPGTVDYQQLARA